MAQDLGYFDLPPEELLSTPVSSATKVTQRVSDTAAAVYVITGEDIKKSGVRNVAEALRLAPGVQVARTDANSWAISIRGFNNILNNKLLVMIDNRTVYNPLFAGTYWELQDILLEDIDRIEVVRGPGGALWGANAVNGVINIITKSASETQGNLVTGLYGDEIKGEFAGRHGGRFGENGFYRAYAKYFNRDSFKQPGSDEDAQDDWESWRSGFRADWEKNATVQGDIYRTLTDTLNSTPTLTAPYAIIEKEKMDSRGANLLGRWRKTFDDGGALTLQSYLDYFERDQILLKDKRTIFDLESQYNFAQSLRHQLIVGGGYRFLADDLSSPAVVTFDPASRQESIFNAFAQDRITLIPESWYLTLGAKLEYNDYTHFEIQPSARLKWYPDETQMVWAAVSRAVRTPSRLEHDLTEVLTIFPPSTQVILQPNSGLDSEELIAYEIGYRKEFSPDFAMDIAAFYNDYNDRTTFGFPSPTPGVFPVTTVNNSGAESYGGELVAKWRASPRLDFTATYSYIDIAVHVDETGGFDLETDEGTTPQHQASLMASWGINDNWALDTTLYYTDQLPAYDIDNYVRLDMNLGWQLNENLRFNLVGQNLLDDAHREFSAPASLNAAEVERSVFGKLTWEF